MNIFVDVPREQLCCLKGTLITTTCLTTLALLAGGVAAAVLLEVPVIATLVAGTLIATFAVEILVSALVVAVVVGLFLATTLLCNLKTPVVLDDMDSLLAPPTTDAWREKMRQRYGIGSSTE